LPENLTIDEILAFRKDKRTKQFREWLGCQLQRLMEMKEITSINFDEEMHRDFLELLDTYKERVKRVSAVLTVLASGVAGIYNGRGCGPCRFPTDCHKAMEAWLEELGLLYFRSEVVK